MTCVVSLSLEGEMMRKRWKAPRMRKGQGVVEYALILVLIAIVVLLALTAFGTSTSNSMDNIRNTLP